MARGGITTRRGDSGETDLPGGLRQKKSASAFQVLGSLDELSSSVGLYRTELAGSPPKRGAFLRQLQEEIVAVSGVLAGYPGGRQPSSSSLDAMDAWIQHWERVAPPELLKDWAFPGDTDRASALADQARAIARRAERDAVAFSELNPQATRFLPWLNRLSDFLWWMARLGPSAD